MSTIGTHIITIWLILELLAEKNYYLSYNNYKKEYHTTSCTKLISSINLLLN